jgi:CRISPR-associated endonuclease/helicase Cas3
MESASYSSKILSHPDKTLREHLCNVAENSGQTVQSLSVDLSRVGLTGEDLADLCWTIGICHDYGKATPFFQQYLREPDEKTQMKLRNRQETHHAHISSLFTYHQLKSRFKDSGSPIAPLIPLIGYEVVRRHHGNLENMQQEMLGKGDANTARELEVLRKQNTGTPLRDLVDLYTGIFPEEEIQNFTETLEDTYKEVRKSRRVLRKTRQYGVASSILTLFCFSVLVCMDKEDASGLAVKRTPKTLQPDLIHRYRSTLGYDKPATELNEVRNRIYLEAHEKTEKLDLDRRILSLNMPTGSGKTFTGLNFALRLRDRLRREKGMEPRIIYCVSFISIIDQNSKIFEDAYHVVTGCIPSSDTILKHHHLADVLYDTEGSEHDYDTLDSLFLVEGWNSETVFTTFVQFFHSILTNKNRALLKLHRVANSIVLLDEVQSIPPKYWPLLKEYLSTFSEFFHTYFVFMTATMPYIFPENEITEIVDDPEQYHAFFNRVDLNPQLEERPIEEYLDEITDKIRDNPEKRYLLIHNTVKSSQQVYRHLLEKLSQHKIIYLSTMVTPKERLRRITIIKENKEPIVVVSTQLVEAGVDIDVDVVYRDMAPMDSVVQAAGRCNRNFGETRGQVYLVNLVDKRPFYTYIYGYASVLVNRTCRVLDQLSIPESGFRQLIDSFYRQVQNGVSRDESRKILEHLQRMEFSDLKDFKLIAEDYPKVDVYVEDDKEAAEIWKEYRSVKEIKDWKERRKRYLKIKRQLLEHVISVPESYRNQVAWTEEQGMGHITLEDGLYDPEIGFIRDQPASSTLII